MFQFYYKEKFDVLRMFRLIVSSRYRRVRKMQLHVVLFALFIYTIFKEDNTPVICIHGSPRRWGKVLDNYFLIVPAVPGKCGHLFCWHVLKCRVGQEQGCYHQLVPTVIPGLWKVIIIIPAHSRRSGSSGYK